MKNLTSGGVEGFDYMITYSIEEVNKEIDEYKVLPRIVSWIAVNPIE
jgi:hypothetical protein